MLRKSSSKFVQISRSERKGSKVHLCIGTNPSGLLTLVLRAIRLVVKKKKALSTALGIPMINNFLFLFFFKGSW